MKVNYTIGIVSLFRALDHGVKSGIMAVPKVNNMWSSGRARWTRLDKGDNINAHNEYVDSLRLILFLVLFIVKSTSLECKEREPLAGQIEFFAAAELGLW